MNQAEQEMESARFRQAIAQAWVRRDRRLRLSRLLGYFCGRCAHYLRLFRALCQSSPC